MSNKLNINRPFLKREDISERKNFQKVLLDYKKASTPIYKTSRFYGAMSLAAVVVSVVVYFAFFRVSETMKQENNQIANSNTDTVISQGVSALADLSSDSTNSPIGNNVSKPFINPPLPGLAKKFTTFKIDASAGGEIKYETGSSIKIPAGCFVDAKGNPVNGKVDIQYREFHDAVDFFLSGIPMTYDSGGVQYTFESAGMMDIKGFQNEEPVFVSKDKNIAVSIASKYNGSKYNLYFLDTLKRSWSYKGKDVITEKQAKDTLSPISYIIYSSASYISDETNENGAISKTLSKWEINDSVANKIYSAKTLVLKNDLDKIKQDVSAIEESKPLEPKMARSNRAHFQLEVDTTEFPEITAYREVLFQIGDENKDFNNDAFKITYDDVILEEHKKGVSYKLTLGKNGKSSTYIVYPVYEEKDFKRVREKYAREFAVYQSRFTQRKADELKKLNELEARKERELEMYRQKQLEMNQQNLFEEKLREFKSDTSVEIVRTSQTNGAFSIEYYKNQENLNTENLIYRTFTLSGFGTYNCDSPDRLPKGANVAATFTDEKGDSLYFNHVYFVYKGRNALFSYYGIPQINVRFDPRHDNVLWAVTADNKIAVFSKEDFKSINTTSGPYTFKMKLSEANFKDENEVRRFLNI